MLWNFVLILLPAVASPFYSFISIPRSFGASSLRMARVKQAVPRTGRRYNTWTRMIRRLDEYYSVHGHSRVSSQDDPTLHKWMYAIRSNYRHQLQDSERQPRLTDDQLEALQRVDFCWNPQHVAWNERYEELCQFYREHSHACVPSNHTSSQLVVWVRNQRREYRYLLEGKNTTLSEERLEALTMIGLFNATMMFDQLWDLRLKELQDFYQQYNHSNVPEDYHDNFALGQWVMNVRTHYKRYLAGMPSCLTPARIAALETLDFRWNLFAYKWFQMLTRTQQAYEENVTDLEPDLQTWLTKQRHFYQRGLQERSSPLTEKRIQALESIPGFSWSGRTPSEKQGPSTEDWAKLFDGIREKGIQPGMRPKQHWFEGQNRPQEVKDTWTEAELLALWNQESDDSD